MNWFERILDPNGNQSSTRLILIWLVVNATIMGWVIITSGTEYASEALTVMGGTTAIAGVLKYVQKRQESSSSQEKETR